MKYRTAERIWANAVIACISMVFLSSNGWSNTPGVSITLHQHEQPQTLIWRWSKQELCIPWRGNSAMRNAWFISKFFKMTDLQNVAFKNVVNRIVGIALASHGFRYSSFAVWTYLPDKILAALTCLQTEQKTHQCNIAFVYIIYVPSRSMFTIPWIKTFKLSKHT